MGEEAHQPSWTKHEQEALDCKESLKNRGKQFYVPSRENGKPSAMETEVFPTHFPIPLPCQLVTWMHRAGVDSAGEQEQPEGGRMLPGCAGAGEGGGHVTHSPGCQK